MVFGGLRVKRLRTCAGLTEDGPEDAARRRRGLGLGVGFRV